jgi:hypothetical protein
MTAQDLRRGGASLRGGPAFVLLLVAAAFLVRPTLIGGDEPHFAAMASSIAFDRDLDLQNQYDDVAAAQSFAAGKRFAGQALDRHLVEKPTGLQFSHPAGLPAFAAPFLWIAQRLLGLPWPDPLLGLLSLLSCCAGLVCGGDLLGRLLGDPRQGRWVAALVFFSSPLWFYSRTFFTEPFVWSGLVVGTWLIAGRRAIAGGVLFGLVVLVREPSLVVIAPVLAGTLMLAGRGPAVRAAIGPAVALGVAAARNLLLNGGGLLDFPQPFRYGDVAGGTLGLLFDSAHGLVPFWPLSLLAPIGFTFGGNRTERVVLACAGTAFAAYFLLAASWVDWRGGSCFGPRLVVPGIALLAPAIALAWRRLGASPVRLALLALAALGTGIEVAAIADPFHAFWSPALGALLSRSTSTAATFAVAAALAFVTFRRFSTRSESIVNEAAIAGRSGSDSIVRGL